MELMMTKLRRPVAAFLVGLFICSAPLLGYRRAQAAAITTAVTASFAYDALATLFVVMCGYKIYDAITTDENGKAVPTEQSKTAFRNAAEKAGYSEVEVREEINRKFAIIEGGGGKEPNMNQVAKLALQSSVFKKVYDTYRDIHSQDAEGTEVTETYYEDKGAFFNSVPNYYHADGKFNVGDLLYAIYKGNGRYSTLTVCAGLESNEIPSGYVTYNDYYDEDYVVIYFKESSYDNHFILGYIEGVYSVFELREMLKSKGYYYINIQGRNGFTSSTEITLLQFPARFLSNSIINFPLFRSYDLFTRWRKGEIGFDSKYLINPNGVVKPGTNYEIQTNPDAEVKHLEDVASMEDLKKVLEEYPIEEIVGQTNSDSMADAEPDPDLDPDLLPEEEFPEQNTQDFEVPAAVINKFPFCIPFDLIKTVQVLAASPEAPVFELPFYFPRYGIDEKITIDFKQFESLAKISRYFFDLLFILGLILLTRGLIKG